ncbi:MAG: hypothetical protein OQK09_10525 [Colwellia sp.]|nr:hypothetical protein [Colwellia sp.]MCW9081934.1 hypothetical protein [Colwellia sp.]
MTKNASYQTHFTRQVQVLQAKIYGRSKLKDSMLERAIGYFESQEFTANTEKKSDASATLEGLEQTERSSHLLSICQEIIELTEGEDFEETNRKSAQLLGTIQLISPTEGKKVAANNEQCKSLYKAILSVRLLDRLLLDNNVSDKNIARIINEFPETAYADFDSAARKRFTEQVKIPLLMASLLQDIGNYHPQAQAILLGEDKQQNPYRNLDVEQRKKLLQLNYKHTLNYLIEGLGVTSYVGNSKEERDQFVIDEQAKKQFIQHLLKSSVKPQQGVGNLLKVPQIYTSIIFSTKESYNYKVLPKVYQVVNKNAELGACSQKVVDALYQITGMFPQGYGVIYMPEDELGQQGGCYEYAIVNRLYPPVPEQPLCRIATRKLTFIGYGHNIEVKKTNNLYFPHMAKKVASLSKERLNEILELLASNFQERQELDLLPRCWHANEYFSVRENQKLWNRENN